MAFCCQAVWLFVGGLHVDVALCWCSGPPSEIIGFCRHKKGPKMFELLVQ